MQFSRWDLQLVDLIDSQDVVERSPKALLTVRFVIIDQKIGEKLMEASECLRQEELRIENGEEVSSVLSEHEVSFGVKSIDVTARLLDPPLCKPLIGLFVTAEKKGLHVFLDSGF